MNTFTRHALALALGVLTVLAWAPIGLWPLAPWTFGLLFALIVSTQQPMGAASMGLLFGLGLHLTGHSWVYTMLLGPVGLGALPAGLATGVIMLALASFTALPCALQAALVSRSSQPLLQAAAFASLMTAGEMARAQLMGRFSSLSLGYSLIDTWLAGWAPVLGTYGLSWAGYCIGAVLWQTLFASQQGTKHRLRNVLPVLACILLGLVLQQVRWTKSLATPLRFRLVQPNTEQRDKFDPASKVRITQQVLTMLTAEPSDLVVTPETAFPMFWSDLPVETLVAMQDFVEQSGTHLVFGIATVGKQSEGLNSMLHLAPGSTAVSHYDKIHLFPFGEFSPPGLAWVARSLAIPMQDLSSGAAVQAPFRLVQQQSTNIGTITCNENMLSDEARRWAPVAHVLINPANMAWFDGTLAIPQGLQITRMRALEVSRPILRVSNAGELALILASGAVAQSLPAKEAASLSGTVTGEVGLTPYARWGDWPLGALCLLSLCFLLRENTASRPRPPQSRETVSRYNRTG